MEDNMKKIDDFINSFALIFSIIIFLIVAIANWEYTLPLVLAIAIITLISNVKEYFKNK
jgi:hypothetical protein